MKYYFETEERQKQLGKIINSWLGTPFRHRCAVKGMGADCLGFVVGVLKELGILRQDFIVPEYAPDWPLHKSNELLLSGMKKTLNIEIVKLEDIMNGDLCLYRFGKASSHIGIYYDNYLYHSITELSVMKLKWSDCLDINNTLLPMTHIIRLLEV